MFFSSYGGMAPIFFLGLDLYAFPFVEHSPFGFLEQSPFRFVGAIIFRISVRVYLCAFLSLGVEGGFQDPE